MRANLLDRFRSILITALIVTSSVLSSPAQATAVDPTFTFKGGGWGHGIGLSQYGAQGYAKKGWKYDAIIKHYYQGTKIVSKPTVTIRVNIEDGAASRSQWKIRAGADTALVVAQESDTSIRKTLDATKSYWITTASGNTQLRADSSGAPGSVLHTFSGACYATAGGLVQMVGTSGPFNHAGVRWRGTIHFQPPSTTSNTSRAVNYVNIEDYLYGVVPRESPSSWHAEALKAQAIAARSYAYQDGLKRRTIYCTTKSQVYNGHSRPGYNHEAASTNSAVDATEAKVVWYGSETQPVKTYFSACSGGHTANIEDVWTTSSPKPYYKGVTDADQASPYYTWTAGPYSAKTVADKIRALDIARGGGLEYSMPAPAVVTGISTERAHSGYTHHVKVTWSTGDTFRLTGTTMQSAMRLRSSKYAVSRVYPTVKKTRYQESDTRLAWYGRWTRLNNSSLSSGAMRFSSTAGSSLSANFSGTGIAWVAKRGPAHGKAAVYIDGRLVRTVDLYASKTQYRRTVFSTTSLNSGSHTLVIRVLGKRRSGAKGYAITVDALDVVNGSLSQASTGLRRYEQNQERLSPLGAWSNVTSSLYSGDTVLRTNAKDAAFYGLFYGNEVRLIGTTGPIYGRAKISIDGAPAEEVVLTEATTAYQQVIYAKSGLAQDRLHRIVVTPLGEGSGGSGGIGDTGGYAAIDALEVRGGWLLPAWVPASMVDEPDARVGWTGSWGTVRASQFLGGSHKWTRSGAAATSITFQGTGITWIGSRSRTYGKTRVYLDGVYKGTVDQYRYKTAYRQAIWSSGWLPCGTHTLELKPLAAHSRPSSGNVVSVDAFRVYGRALGD